MTPACLALQAYRGFGDNDKPFMACSLESCSKWCEQEFGRSIGSIGFGCQNVGGADTLAFCECAEGGRADADVTRAVLCHELLACATCEHGYCSTSPEKSKLHYNACVACDPEYVLLPTGVCVNATAGVEAALSCPSPNPCMNGGECIDGPTASKITSFSCKCKEEFEGPLCNSGKLRFNLRKCAQIFIPPSNHYIFLYFFKAKYQCPLVNPCGNNGVCRSGTCECSPGYQGKYCELGS